MENTIESYIIIILIGIIIGIIFLVSMIIVIEEVPQIINKILKYFKNKKIYIILKLVLILIQYSFSIYLVGSIIGIIIFIPTYIVIDLLLNLVNLKLIFFQVTVCVCILYLPVKTGSLKKDYYEIDEKIKKEV